MRRRSPEDGGHSFTHTNGTVFDNRHVAVYNPVLTCMFESHIYVEFVTGLSAIKYLFQYIFKGEDRVAFSTMFADPFSPLPRERNEQVLYSDAMYLVGMSACWKRLGFPIYSSDVPVQLLRFYVGSLNYLKDFMMDAFFELCSYERMHPEEATGGIPVPRAYDLRFTEVNRYYRFTNDYAWIRRSRRHNGISRLMQVDIRRFNGELYYLRILFYHVVGPVNEAAMRTFAGNVYPTYLDAVIARGLIVNDSMWRNALLDAVQFRNPRALRGLFVTLLLHNNIINPLELWEEFRNDMTEDFSRTRALNHRPMLPAGAVIAGSQDDWDHGLRDIQRLLALSGSCNDRFDLPNPPVLQNSNDERSILLRRVASCLAVDPTSTEENLRAILATRELSLSDDQRRVYLQFCQFVDNATEGVHIVQAWAGSGKTFVANTLLLRHCLNNQIVASGSNSGLASQLISWEALCGLCSVYLFQSSPGNRNPE